MITAQSVLKANEKAFLDELLRVTPAPYLNTPDPENIRNYKLLGIAQWALWDVNNEPPQENYTFNTLQKNLFPMMTYGTQFYLMQMKQMEFSLVDISYNSQGLSLTIDRVGKINTPLGNFEKNWGMFIAKWKKGVIIGMGGVGLATPRFQSSMSRVIVAMSQGGAFGWNVP